MSEFKNCFRRVRNDMPKYAFSVLLNVSLFIIYFFKLCFFYSLFSSLVRRNNFQCQWEVSLSPVPGLTLELSQEENANFAKTMANPRINSVATFCEIQTLVNWFVLSSGRKFAKCVEPLETKPTPEITAPKLRRSRKTGNYFLNKSRLCIHLTLDKLMSFE